MLEMDCHQAHDSSNKLPDTKSDISTESTHIPSDSNNDISDDDIISLVRRECKKGDYNMSIIPIDIWDFGGQKIYYPALPTLHLSTNIILRVQEEFEDTKGVIRICISKKNTDLTDFKFYYCRKIQK
jgi:hypothetical protein